MYLPDVLGKEGRALFLDLDIVIQAPLDDFFSFDAEYAGMAEGPGWKIDGHPSRPSLNSSVVSFDLGAQAQIADILLADTEAAVREHKNDQNFAAAYARGLRYWPPGWVCSYKRHLRRPVVIDRFVPPEKPPKFVKIVVFHGRPKPADLAADRRGNADTAPHYARGPVRWISDYWRAATEASLK
jgi:hypothetical protein